MEKAYDLIQSVNKSVDAAHSKISDTDIKLTIGISRVSKNRDDITISKKENEEELKKLKELIEKITNERIQGFSFFTPNLMSGSSNVSIESVMIHQANFILAVQLGNSSTMVFNGDLNKYVQFVTMFRNNFDKTIGDSSALFKLVGSTHHVSGKKGYRTMYF